MLTRRIARPLMAGIFISGGIDVLRNPGPRVQRAEPVTAKLAEALPLPDDTETLVRLNAAVHIVAGAMLALGKPPRPSAAALAVPLVPTTAAGHRFREEEPPASKALQPTHLLHNP